jgi:hypothetical protein
VKKLRVVELDGFAVFNLKHFVHHLALIIC